MIIKDLTTETAHGAHLCKELERIISECISEIETQLVGDLSYIHHRAECFTGVVVEQVDYQSDNEYLLTYSFEWTVYNGCADMNDQDTTEESISFTVEDDGSLEFSFVELTERNTADEF